MSENRIIAFDINASRATAAGQQQQVIARPAAAVPAAPLANRHAEKIAARARLTSIYLGLCGAEVPVSDLGERVKTAGPSDPVEVIGFNDVPDAGDIISAVDDDSLSRKVAEERKDKMRAALIKHGNAPEWLYYRTEGHGIYNDESRLDMMTKLVAFLDANIGTAKN